MSDTRQNFTRFYFLDLLRGVAAFGIVVFHLSGNAKPLNALYVFVDFFFVLSGFVLFEQIPMTRQISDLKKFMKKRINRLVPTAWLAVIVSYFIYSIFLFLDLIRPQEKLNLNGLTFISALLFLQFIVPSSAVLLIPMWSLSVEMFMNLFFAFIGATWTKLVLVASISFSALSFGVFNSTAVNVSSGWVAFSRGIFAFSCGLIARILHNRKRLNSRIQIVTSSAIVGTIFCFVVFSHYYLILVAPSMSFFIYAISGIRVKKDYLKILCTQSGNFSYGVYLWHFPVNYFVRILMHAIDSHENFYILKIVEFTVTILFSLFLTWITLALFKTVSLFKIK